MSGYCGKCDLWDSLVMIGKVNDECTDWSNIKIYQTKEDSYFNGYSWNNVELLNIKCLKDLLPYAPFIPILMSHCKDCYTVYIPEKSYIDIMEEERLQWITKDILKIYKKLKKEHKSITQEEVLKNLSYLCSNEDTVKEIIKRVIEHPNSFKTDDIRVYICNFYRDRWKEDMIKYGYSEKESYEWCYNNRKIW